MKAGILGGAASCGYDGEGLNGVDGFLLMCAQRYPKHYLAPLGKMLPLNLSANVNSAAIREVRVISVPVERYLSSADIAKINSREPMTIHAEAIEYQQNEAERFQEDPAEVEIVDDMPIANDKPAIEAGMSCMKSRDASPAPEPKPEPEDQYAQMRRRAVATAARIPRLPNIMRKLPKRPVLGTLIYVAVNRRRVCFARYVLASSNSAARWASSRPRALPSMAASSRP